MEEDQAERVPIQVSQGCIVASVQVDLTDINVHQLRTDLLARVQTARPRGVILDLSAIAVMDLVDWNVGNMSKWNNDHLPHQETWGYN